MSSIKELKEKRTQIKKNMEHTKKQSKKLSTYSYLRPTKYVDYKPSNPSDFKKATNHWKKELRNVDKKIALKKLKNATKKAVESMPQSKVLKAYKVTKAGLINFLKKKKK